MSKHITFLLFLAFEVFLILFSVELLIYGFQYKKATDVSEFAIKTAENAGGFTPEVISIVRYRMDQENLDPELFDFEYSSVTRATYGEVLEANISGSFTYRSVNLLGTGKGNITKQINAPNVGYSNVWFRDS